MLKLQQTTHTGGQDLPDNEALEPLLYTVQQVAVMTRRHPEAIRRYIRDHVIRAVPDPNYKPGRNQRKLIPWEELETVMAQPMILSGKKLKLVKRETVLTYSDGSTITVPITMDPRPVPLR
jgi:hypothetical protein